MRCGHCHSVEVWQDDTLAGGLYGVSLGRAFFGESMFHHARDASKVALVHLVARLIAGGFKLLDTQYVTDHLLSFGAQEVPRAALSQAARRVARRHCGVRQTADGFPAQGRDGAGHHRGTDTPPLKIAP